MPQSSTRRHSDGLLPGMWDPVREVAGLQQQIGRLMDGLRSGGAVAPATPRVHVEEREDEYVLEAELPGFTREEVSLELSQGMLRIHAATHADGDGAGARPQRRRLDYAGTLPGDADEESVRASLANGILCVQLAKAHAARGRRIEISDGDGARAASGSGDGIRHADDAFDSPVPDA